MSPQFLNLVKHPLKFRFFLLKNLPSAYFSGVRVRQVDEEKCMVVVPFKWFSTNPFKSTYFACLAMAAEMSTGVLALGNIYKQQPSVSMLVLKMEAEFLKKAVGITSFTCIEGKSISDAVKRTIESGNPETIKVTSIGVNDQQETVAVFYITWTFKAKQTGSTRN